MTSEHDVPMTQQEIEEALDEVMGSPTMQSICDMAVSSPWPARSFAVIQEGLAIMSLQIIQAIDEQQIAFADPELRAMFYGFIALALEAATNGRFASELIPAKLQG